MSQLWGAGRHRSQPWPCIWSDGAGRSLAKMSSSTSPGAQVSHRLAGEPPMALTRHVSRSKVRYMMIMPLPQAGPTACSPAGRARSFMQTPEGQLAKLEAEAGGTPAFGMDSGEPRWTRAAPRWTAS